MDTQWPPAILAAVQEQIAYQESIQIKSITDTLTLDKGTIEERVKESLRVSQIWCETLGVPHMPVEF